MYMDLLLGPRRHRIHRQRLRLLVIILLPQQPPLVRMRRLAQLQNPWHALRRRNQIVLPQKHPYRRAAFGDGVVARDAGGAASALYLLDAFA